MQPAVAPRALGRDPALRADGATWAITVGLGVLAAVATVLANLLIVRGFPDAARPDDLLFELLPHVRPARWLTVVALVLGFGVFLTDLLRREVDTFQVDRVTHVDVQGHDRHPQALERRGRQGRRRVGDDAHGVGEVWHRSQTTPTRRRGT